MKTIILSIGLFLLTLNVFSQLDKAEEWKNQKLISKHVAENEILDLIIDYDFSEILSSSEYQNARIGFIGDNFQRIQIHFISVIKNAENPKQYFVYGKSKVKDNVCEFQGIIELEQARYNKRSEIEGIKQGFIIANYTFYENPTQNHVGYFKGILKSSFYIDGENKLKYYDLSLSADGFKNNEFVGSWINYETKKGKVCNWGDFRIPFSDGLDVGTGEFFPDRKYFEFGWKEYSEMSYDKIDEWWK